MVRLLLHQSGCFYPCVVFVPSTLKDDISRKCVRFEPLLAGLVDIHMHYIYMINVESTHGCSMDAAAGPLQVALRRGNLRLVRRGALQRGLGAQGQRAAADFSLVLACFGLILVPKGAVEQGFGLL